MTETMNRKLHCFAFKSNNKCNYEYKGNEHKKSNASHKCTQHVERACWCVMLVVYNRKRTHNRLAIKIDNSSSRELRVRNGIVETITAYANCLPPTETITYTQWISQEESKQPK